MTLLDASGAPTAPTQPEEPTPEEGLTLDGGTAFLPIQKIVDMLTPLQVMNLLMDPTLSEEEAFAVISWVERVRRQYRVVELALAGRARLVARPAPHSPDGYTVHAQFLSDEEMQDAVRPGVGNDKAGG